MKFGIVVSLTNWMCNKKEFSDIRILKGYSNRDIKVKIEIFFTLKLRYSGGIICIIIN